MSMTLGMSKRKERMNLGTFHAHDIVNSNPTCLLFLLASDQQRVIERGIVVKSKGASLSKMEQFTF